MAGSQLGVLATYDGPDHPGHAMLTHFENYGAVESNLTFVGIAGLLVSGPPPPGRSIHPPRKSAVGPLPTGHVVALPPSAAELTDAFSVCWHTREFGVSLPTSP